MALTAAVGGEFKPVAEGLHPATCISVYDLGTQHSEKFGTDSRQILIQWELADEEREFEGEKYNAKVSKTLTLSMNQKSNLRKMVESWRGKKMSDEEAAKFDVLLLAGKPCMIQVTNTTGGNGKTYANIAAVVSVPKGVIVPAPMARVQTYEMGQPLPERLPEWIMEKITSAPEFAACEAAPADLPADTTAPF